MSIPSGEFFCHMCDFTTDDEDEIAYCDDCGKTTCLDHSRMIDHQGYAEQVCDNGKCR